MDKFEYFSGLPEIGIVPRAPHAGPLLRHLYEQEHGRGGFAGKVSHTYHLYPPTNWLPGETRVLDGFAPAWESALRPIGGTHVLLDVAPAELRVARDLAAVVAAHEREIQRPPGQPQHRHPEQRTLEEEAQQRDAPVEHLLQYQDVDPALVVGQHQVMAVALQVAGAVDVEPRRGEAVDHRAVDRDPVLGQAGQQWIAGPPHGGQRQHRLEQAHQQQRQGMDQGIGHDQQQDRRETQPDQ